MVDIVLLWLFLLLSTRPVGEDRPPEVDIAHLHPPLKMLQIISHWIEVYPSFLFPSQLLDQHNTPKLPLINSNSSSQALDFYSSRSPIVGLIQWCVVSPLTASLNLYGQKSNVKSPTLKSPKDPFNNQQGLLGSKATNQTTKVAATMVAEIHANLLSLLLSGLQQPLVQLTGNHSHLVTTSDVDNIVSALTGFREKLSTMDHSKGVATSLGSGMEESVERFAQFLQILLSTGLLSMSYGESTYTSLLSLSPSSFHYLLTVPTHTHTTPSPSIHALDEIVLVLSSVPKNRLLQLVISNSRHSNK